MRKNTLRFLIFNFSIGLIALGIITLSIIKALPGRTADLEGISQRGYLIVAVKDNLRPLGFRDNQGQWQGLEIDIAKRLAKELLGNAEAIKLQAVANTDRLKVVLNNQVDMTIAGVTRTESRSRLVSFSPPYYMDSTTLVIPKNKLQQLQQLQQLNDLKNLKIAVLKGSTTIATIKYYLPTAKLTGVDSYQEALTVLENNHADAFAGDASVLAGWVQEYPQYHLLPVKFSSQALCIVMAKGLQYDALRQKVTAAIEGWQNEGWLTQRAQYWGLP